MPTVRSWLRLLDLDVLGGPKDPLTCRLPKRPSRFATVPSSSGLGHYPLKVGTRVQIPLGLLVKRI